jgi:hypothetical protein
VQAVWFEQENAAAALSARNDGQQSFSADRKHRRNPTSVYPVTSVFKNPNPRSFAFICGLKTLVPVSVH